MSFYVDMNINTDRITFGNKQKFIYPIAKRIKPQTRGLSVVPDFVPEINSDTFEYINKKSAVGFIKKIKEITEKTLNDSIKRANFIGFGGEGDVYIIPNSMFCFKIPYGIRKIEGLTYQVSKKDNINHVVAKTKDGVLVMKYIEGKSIYSLKDDVSAIYDLPEEKYKKLFKQVSHAYKKGMSFDPAPSNVIYNKANKTLTAIDFFEPHNEEKYTSNYLLTEIYTCIRSVMNTKYGDKEHIRFLKKFMRIILNELTADKLPEFTVKSGDIENLFEKIKEDIPYEIPKRFDLFKENLKRLADIKEALRAHQKIEI